MDIKKELIEKALVKKRTIVFPEAGFSERIRQAGLKIAELGFANIVLIGSKNDIMQTISEEDISKFTVIDPKSTPLFDVLANKIYEARKEKGITIEDAKKMCLDPIYFANSYVACGYADGIVCGAEVSTATTIRSALQIIKSKAGLVSSYFLFNGQNRVTDNAFLMGDCAVVENPTAEQECLIAENLLNEFNLLGLKNPKIAFLSYSTLKSAKSESVEKVQKAYAMFKEKHPNIDAVGEVQFDSAILKNVASVKMPNYQFTKPANIFIMPNIDAGNIGYKMVQYFGGLEAIGPITTGFNKPVNDLSRGCSVEDIVLLTAITCIQC